MSSCHRHRWEIADGVCSDCELAFCRSCLFYVTKTSEEPMCVPCALSKAGVRKAREPRASRRHKRAVAAARRRTEQMLEEAAATATEAPAELDGMADGATAQPSWVTLDNSSWDVRPA